MSLQHWQESIPGVLDRDETDFPEAGRGYSDEPEPEPEPEGCRFCGRVGCTDCENEP